MTLTVGRMSGFATIQDRGRPGYRADGVPPCGAMDIVSLERANALVGNGGAAAAIEWALAGGTLRFSASAVVAVTGPDIELTRNSAMLSTNVAVEFGRGDELAIGRLVRGTYAYIAVRGGFDVPVVLGSRSTYLPAGFGGLEGRRLRAGDVLAIGFAAKVRSKPKTPRDSGPAGGEATAIRAVEGPNTAAFSRAFAKSFWASEFTLSPASNRTGYRLERESDSGPPDRSAVSEPACVGAIQVPDGASAIVLMPDGPTVGGYPKIGVVASVDIPALAQRMPDDTVRFERITVEEAQRLLRERRSLAGR
ncbi:MAG: biotin-dependent carboxyltransferase family protein [Gemmatimonadaceae bacterium]|nr:biotin-dependent carboxyltransferase family protein [Gemmatimonadaceae bacterium]